MRVATFVIEDVRCEACAERVRMLLQRQHGVHEACVPFAGGGEAWVRFNPHVITFDRLAALIEQAGFRIAKGA